MKKLIIGLCVLGTSACFAVSAPTDLNTNWICTTNASSSSDAKDKAADEQASKAKGSIAQSFKFAAEHCRDCTKVTCEAKD